MQGSAVVQNTPAVGRTLNLIGLSADKPEPAQAEEWPRGLRAHETKVFCFFFSKKKILSCLNLTRRPVMGSASLTHRCDALRLGGGMQAKAETQLSFLTLRRAAEPGWRGISPHNRAN
jgi:hypothetical protein